MKEQDEIDKAFKDQLFDRESQLDPNALIAAMGLLEQHDREIIASKRRSRFVWMVIGSVALLFSLAVFMMNQTQNDQSSTKNPNEKPKVEHPQKSNTPTSSNESENVNTSGDSKSSETTPELQQQETTSITHLSKPSKKEERGYHSPAATITQNGIEQEQSKTFPSSTKFKSTTFSIEESQVSVVEHTQTSNLEQYNLTNNPVSAPAILHNENVITPNPDNSSEKVESESVVEQNTADPIESQAFFEESTIASNEKDSLQTIAETLAVTADSAMTAAPTPAMIYPPTPDHKLVLFGGVSGYQISSSFRDRGNELGDYISQRNNQETAIQTWGADLGLMHLMHRSSLRLGLGFYASGENVQYQGMKTTTTNDTTSYWEHSNLWLQIIDATPIDGIYVFDTTYISVNADSTLHTDVTSNSEISNNADLQRNNGKTKMYHVTIPVTYSFNVIQTQRMNVAILGGVEADYRITNNARYLAPNRETTTSLPSFDGYRKFMLNGSVGLELQYGSAMSKIGFTAGVGLKRNLYSWNKNFSHIYSSPWVRLGVVFRL